MNAFRQSVPVVLWIPSHIDPFWSHFRQSGSDTSVYCSKCPPESTTRRRWTHFRFDRYYRVSPRSYYPAGPNQAESGAFVLVPELQFARCMSNRYKSEGFPRCVACTRRWAGDTCRFQGIRYFMRDQEGKLMGISFNEASPSSESSKMEFPTRWNRKFEREHIRRTKVSGH